MKTTSLLEINFFEKDTSSNLKDPIRIELSLLKNGCYTLSNFETHGYLQYVLSDWLHIHNKLVSLKTMQNKYREFLSSSLKTEVCFKPSEGLRK